MLPNKDIQEREVHLRDYAQAILRQKWVLIVSFIIVVTTVTIYSFKATPIYQATTQVMIDKENPNVISFEEVMSLESTDIMFYQTQYKVLASRSLARRVINSLNLKDNPEFKPDEESRGFLGTLVKKLRQKSDKATTQRDKDGEKSKLIDNYLARLKVEPVRNSSLVNISFEGAHPDIVTTIVDKHAEEYITRNLEVRFAASQDAVKWLQKQLYEKRERVEKTENALQLYKEKEKIVSLEDRQNIIVQKLEEVNTALTEARTERMGLETLYNLSKEYSKTPGMIESISEVTKNLLIQDLKMEYAGLSAEIANLSDKYGKNHPAMRRATSMAKELKSKIDDEVNKIIKSIETDYRVALSKEENLSNALEDQKEKALGLNRKAIAYGTLKRESESERAMYDILLKRLKETDITGALQTSNIRVVDLAEVPIFPIKPRKKLNILLGAIFGLGLGIGLIFFLEYLDNTIKSPEDVERYLGIPLLGVLAKSREQASSTELIAHELPRSVFAEAVRSVRTSVAFSIIDKPKKLIMVTSAVQGEGKSFLVSNLASTFALAGNNTLIVDTDLRKPRLNEVFNVTRNPGLSNHLIGENDLESIVKSTSIPDLSIITCGIIPPNPSEILTSTAMEKFCEAVREKFDIVIFDTPPSMTVTDAVVLSRIMDGVIITIKSGEPVRETVKRCISQLASSKCDILGAVINYADIAKGGYYYHYYAHYYKYGYASEKELVEAKKV